MKIIFCSSYLEAPTTVTRIETAQDDFVIVTSNSSLEQFFISLYPRDKIILIKTPPPLLTRSVFGTIKNQITINTIKKETWERLKGFKDCEVYFSALAYCEFEAWLALKLLKNNTVFYKPVVTLKGLKVRYTVYSILYLILNKLIYGLNLQPLWNGKCFQCSVVNYFLNNKKIVKADFPVNRDIIQKHPASYVKDKSVLLLVGGITENGLVSEDEYIHKMDELINYLIRKFGLGRLVIKRHPLSLKFYSRENEIAVIPHFVPANLIFTFFKVVIGYQTAGLFEAANENKTAVSLLKYFRSRDENVRMNYINYLKSNTAKTIYFPATVRELDLILDKSDTGGNHP
ncbi:MAG: hypothetical protein PHF84_02905 [bacterium]|nr:hypothetical protein [bacterium]